jgi:hypothetical protein
MQQLPTRKMKTSVKTLSDLSLRWRKKVSETRDPQAIGPGCET